MTDLDVIGEGNVLYFNTKRAIVRLRYFQKRKWIHALLSIPLSEELAFLTKLGDILREGLDRGHFDESGLRGWLEGTAGGRPRVLIF